MCVSVCIHWGFCMQEHCQNIGVRMHGEAPLVPVMALDFLASERRKLFTLCPTLLPMAIIMLSGKA